MEKIFLIDKRKYTGINYLDSIVQVIKADELAYLRYVPPTGYPNRITLFKTSEIYQDELGMLYEGFLFGYPDILPIEEALRKYRQSWVKNLVGVRLGSQ